jgi:ankyrin repeat protein
MTTPIDVLLYDAARDNDITQIDFILDTYSDTILPYSPNIAYWIASKYGNKSIVKYLIPHVTDFNWHENEYDETPLIVAVKNKHYDTIELLLQNKSTLVNYECQVEDDKTALNFAIDQWSKNKDNYLTKRIVFLLIRYDAQRALWTRNVPLPIDLFEYPPLPLSDEE